MKNKINLSILILIFCVLSYNLFSSNKKYQLKNTIGGFKNMNFKVVFIIAPNNFRDEEYFVPLDYLSKNGVEVRTASTVITEVKGMLGGLAKPDLLYNEIKLKDFDGIIFVGGTGASIYWNDEIAHNLIKESFNLKKIIGAICIAPVTLANSGVLVNKKATVFPSEKDKLIQKKAKYVSLDVVKDENIITASGPQAAQKFAEEILKLLKSEYLK